MADHRTTPWKKAAPPKTEPSLTLSAENKAWAQARAKQAGRRYPNLVDNMAAARKQREEDAQRHGVAPDHP